jgi:EAL domain-containing protein (putative c-di-GMP-specific phosphodiesterase class I)
MLVKRHHEMEAVGRIQMAIKEDRLTLVAQIIEPLRRKSSRIHVEVLVRLRDIDGELILPGTFIPAAERYHLMPELDRWVIEKAFDMLEQSPRQSRQRFSMLSINLSGQTLNEPDFGRWLTERLGRLQFPLERICFEITETAAVANLDEATAFMSAIKSYGCRFALDDFGSGLSSFGYLRSLPIDFLKIDGALVREIADDAVAASMVAAVQQVASVMNLQTVAEFVESERVKNVLDAIGVDFVQGYAIGRPKPLAEYLYRASSDSQALTA